MARDTAKELELFILKTLQESGEVSLTALLDKARLESKINDVYTLLQVKHSLEERKVIKVKVGMGPHRMQLIKLNGRKNRTVHYR